MNKNNIVTKALCNIKIEGICINIFCAHNVKTHFISVRTDRKTYFKHEKKNMSPKINKQKRVCGILKEYQKNLKNDPERLSQDFILEMIDINNNTIEII